jgi:putative DNA primase/helicase
MVLELLNILTAQPLFVANSSAAAVFRAVDAWKPTLLLDEAETFLPENEELRGVLNAGYARNGKVLRCDGDQLLPAAFSCFAPAVLAAIGTLPATIADRAIPIRMQRAPAGHQMRRLDRVAREELQSYPPRLKSWADEWMEVLTRLRPERIPALSDRKNDICEPLLAIAMHAGEKYLQRAQEALVRLCTSTGNDAAEHGERVLCAVWEVYQQRPNEEFLSLKTICTAMNDDELGGWDTAVRGRPIDTAWLARKLRQFVVEPRRSRTDERNRRGYPRSEIEALARQYLPARFTTEPVAAQNSDE